MRFSIWSRDHVIDSTDLAALAAGNNLLHTLPSPVHVQRGLSLVEDSVVFESSDYKLSLLGPLVRKLLPEAI